MKNSSQYQKMEDIFLKIHHINENKTNNDIENLQILSRGEHTRLHNLKSPVKRDKRTGKFVHD